MAFVRNNNNNGRRHNNNYSNNHNRHRSPGNPNQGSAQHTGQGGPRRHVNRVNQVFESNGPDGRIRGTAQQIVEKYTTLGRDASVSGDKVLMLNYFQHAEHYQRLLNEINEENAGFEREREQQRQQQQPQPDASSSTENSDAFSDGNAPQPNARPEYEPQQRENRESQQRYEPRENREPREPREPREAREQRPEQRYERQPQQDQQQRAPREERVPYQDRGPRPERAERQNPEPRPQQQERSERPQREERQPRHAAPARHSRPDDEDDMDNELPSFLHVPIKQGPPATRAPERAPERPPQAQIPAEPAPVAEQTAQPPAALEAGPGEKAAAVEQQNLGAIEDAAPRPRGRPRGRPPAVKHEAPGEE